MIQFQGNVRADLTDVQTLIYKTLPAIAGGSEIRRKGCKSTNANINLTCLVQTNKLSNKNVFLSVAFLPSWAGFISIPSFNSNEEI